MKRRLIDTNLIIRHLVQDHEAHAKAAGKLFEACDSGDLILVLLPSVLSECIFVLESFYKHSRERIVDVLSKLIASPGIEISERAILLDALQRYAKTKMHFVDCTLAAYAVAQNCPVASFDAGFRKFSDVQVLI
jgi:predicted nucleic-acid-binding protein